MEKLKFGEISALGNLVVVLTLLLAVVWQIPKFDFFSEPAPYVHLHSILETAAILVSLVVAMLALSQLQRPQNNHALILGLGFLVVCAADIFHTLSYQGMPDFFGPSDPEKAINFWLAGRMITATILLTVALLSPAHVNRTGRITGALLSLAAVAIIFTLGFFYQEDLPRTFIAGQGLTPLKIGIELVIFAAFGLAALIFMRKRKEAWLLSSGLDFSLLAAGAWVLGLAELFFTLYGSVTDIFNAMGHIYKVIGTVMIFFGLKKLLPRHVQRAA